MPTADDEMIEAAARRAARRAWRLRPIAGYDRDDALQDGRIGAWQALLRCAEPDHEQRLAIAALAGYRQIIDGRRGALVGVAVTVIETWSIPSASSTWSASRSGGGAEVRASAGIR